MRVKHKALSPDTLLVGGEGWVRERFSLDSLPEEPPSPQPSPPTVKLLEERE